MLHRDYYNSNICYVGILYWLFRWLQFNRNGYQPAIELVGILLPGVVEVKAEVRVDADAEVVIHDENLRVVLALRSCRHRRCNVRATVALHGWTWARTHDSMVVEYSLTVLTKVCEAPNPAFFYGYTLASVLCKREIYFFMK